MKKIKLLSLMLIAILGISKLYAQDIAHVDVHSIVISMPEYKKATHELEILGKKHQTNISKLQSEFKGFVDKVQKELNGKSKYDAERILTTKKYHQKQMDLEKKYESYVKSAQDDLSNKEKALLAPIEKKIMDAISKIANRKGIKYVFQSKMLVFKSDKSYDLSHDVKNELGIK